MPRCLFIGTCLSATLPHVGPAHVNPDCAVRDPAHDCVRVDPAAEPWVPVLLLELGAEDGRGRAVPQLYQLQQHRPELSVRLVQQPSPTPVSGLSLALIVLAMWDLLVLWTAWQPERNGGARECV